MDLHKVTRRLNVSFGAMLVALTLALSGAYFIRIGVREEKSTMKATLPGFKGEIESGSIGIVLIFISMAVTGATLHYDRKQKQDIYVKVGDRELKWSGVFVTIEEQDIVGARLREFLALAEKPNQSRATVFTAQGKSEDS